MKDKRSESPQSKAEKMTKLGHGKTDPQGSYTGQPSDRYEKPVQDADDL